MGIPVVELGKRTGKIDVADCMGCGRCVTECPTGSLAFRDVRDGIQRDRRFVFVGIDRILRLCRHGSKG